MTTTSPAPASTTPPRRRWRGRLGLAALLLALALISAGGWLLGSTAGLRFALARAQAFTGGALSVQRASGRLAGPMDLTGVRYDDGHGSVLTLASLQLDLRLWPLLRRRLHVLTLRANGLAVALPAATPDSPGQPVAWPQPPLALQLDDVQVNALKISRAGQPLFAANRIALAGHWNAQGIALTRLAVRGPDGQLDLTGQLGPGEHPAGNGHAGFAWKFGDTDVAGKLQAHSNGQQAHVNLQLSAPAAANLQLDIALHDDYRWHATLDVPRFNTQALLGDSALQTLATALRASGNREGGTLTGRLDLNDTTVQVQPLRAQWSRDLDTITVQQLQLSSPQFGGSVSAQGAIHLDTQPISGNLALRWENLQLPAGPSTAAAARTSAPDHAWRSEGELQLSGSPARYHAEGRLSIDRPNQPNRLAFNLDGSPRQVTVHSLTLKQAQGSLQAGGTLTLQPRLGWQLQAKASRIDPSQIGAGQLLTGWRGALDLDLRSHGTLAAAGPDATLDIRQLAGTLRARPVSASGMLHLSPAKVIDGQLHLASGRSTLDLVARAGADNDADLSFSMASLGDLLPAASGRLDGHMKVRGRWPSLSVNGTARGSALAWQQQRLATLQLIVGLPDIGHPAGKLVLDAGNAQLAGLRFASLHLRAEGSQGDHQLVLDARGSQLSGALDLHGALRGGAWKGTLSTLDLDPQGLPRWRLLQPVPLSYRDGALSVAELCLSAGEPQLCVAGKQDQRGNLDASYRLQALPLALLLNAAGDADLPIRAAGDLAGSGKLRRSAAGALSGHASLTSASGSITYTDRPATPLLRYDALAIQATFAPASQHVELHAGLDQGGRLDGQISLSGAQQALAGQLAVQLHSLGIVELISPELAHVQGTLDGQFSLAGTLAQPAATGHASVAGFAAEVPSAGLKLDQGRLTVSTADARSFQLDGSVRSGQGSVAIGGSVTLGAQAQAAITLKGSQFTAVDIPAASVVLSPDLTVQQGASGVAVGGSVRLDRAEVNVDKLPGNGAIKASPDVVVVDQPQATARAGGMPLSAQVRLDLGQHTHVVGMGLDGQITGVLTLNEQPGRAATGQGQLAVSGSYRAYGQQLQIERGQLLFASTPLDNPGLNIRAVRKLNPNATIDDGQQVGLQIGGTARRPVLNVFSNPLMEQSDALSYLITGKPLSQVKSGEGNMVSAAAQALGSAGGNLLAKSVGARLGIDDIGVTDSDALGGNSAFTVGKYLSPRLYLSYGVGLFEPGQVLTLRYRLSKRWDFETQNATNFNRASFNYRLEK